MHTPPPQRAARGWRERPPWSDSDPLQLPREASTPALPVLLVHPSRRGALLESSIAMPIEAPVIRHKRCLGRRFGLVQVALVSVWLNAAVLLSHHTTLCARCCCAWLVSQLLVSSCIAPLVCARMPCFVNPMRKSGAHLHWWPPGFCPLAHRPPYVATAPSAQPNPGFPANRSFPRRSAAFALPYDARNPIPGPAKTGARLWSHARPVSIATQHSAPVATPMGVLPGRQPHGHLVIAGCLGQ